MNEEEEDAEEEAAERKQEAEPAVGVQRASEIDRLLAEAAGRAPASQSRDEAAPSAQETQEKGVQVPKDLQCPLCSEYLQPHSRHYYHYHDQVTSSPPPCSSRAA